MLRLTKLTDYGTQVMTYLAHEPGTVHAAAEVAGGVHLSLPTVTKILKILTREGLLASHRGTKGGYALARAPERISMAQVVQAMEGPIGLTECGSAPGACVQESSCSVRGNWQVINRALLAALESVSLAHMATPSQPVRFSVTPKTRTQQLPLGRPET